MRRVFVLTAFSCMGWTVKAQDTLRTVVVTGTKTEIPVEKSGKSIFKIPQEIIDRSSGQSVADLLNEVPGVQMDGNFGPLGTNISYFIRGAASRQTLILIDGIPFNDPSGINQTYDLRLLDLDQVASIEILKGGLSSLYGTGAAAGVINIQLKESGKEAFAGRLGVEYGSFNTFNTHLNINGQREKLSYMFNGSYQSSAGFSAAQDPTGSGDFDKDGFAGMNFLGRMRYQFSERFSVGITGALDDFENDYDQGAFSDGDNSSDYRQVRAGLTPKFKWEKGSVSGNVFFTWLDRQFNSPDFFDPTARFIDEYDASNIQADVVVDQSLTGNLKFIGGLNFQRLAYSQPTLSEQSFSLTDPYASFIFDQSDFTFHAGGRLNIHSEYGSNVVFNLNPSYLVNLSSVDLKVFGSFGSSFTAPSLFQLFGPFGANPNLEPEESLSTEGGLALLSEAFTWEMTYFHRKDENLILFLSEGYANAPGELTTSGIELAGQYQINERVFLDGHYTWVNPLDENEIFRVPRHKFGGALRAELIDGLMVTTSYLHTSDLKQPFFNSETFTTDIITTEAFDLVDLSASYQVGNFRINGAVNNLFDEEYVAIYGFNSIGRNYHVGVNYSF